VKTVENHRAHIKDKLNLKNAIELVQQATLWIQKSQSPEKTGVKPDTHS
jgi:DNA-binding NarL/FixJ family response regulator